MRVIGHLPTEATARTFADYLYVQGIENQVEHQNGEGWAVWVTEEDKIARATELLTVFLQNPADPKYRAEARSAAARRAEQKKDEEAYRKKLKDRRHLFRPLTPYSFGPLSLGLIVLSVAVFILTKFGRDFTPVATLFISEHVSNHVRHFHLPEIGHGEIWRLFTPIFIHRDVLHIFFNMLWLQDLGSMIEGRQSSLQLAMLVLVLAAVSNLAQFYFAGPAFCGMSGVVYGLLGYIWMRGKFDPGSGLFLHSSTVMMMIIWFFACWIGLLGTIANFAHTAGLALGMASGYLSSLRYR